jgi:hypothetical protein
MNIDIILIILVLFFVIYIVRNEQARKRLRKIKEIRMNKNKRMLGAFRENNKRSILEHFQVFFNLKQPDMLYPESIFYRWREKIRERITGWNRSLLWCPSQLQKTYKHKDYKIICYLRWRWQNPWTGNFILEKDNKTFWTEEIFSKYNFDDQADIRTLEKKMEELYKYYFVDKKEKLKLERTKWVEKQLQT